MLDILHEEQGQAVAVHVTEEILVRDIQDEGQLALFVTAHRIQDWVDAAVGDIAFKNILSIQVAPIKSPQFERVVPVPLRDPEMQLPPGDYFQQVHVIGDDEQPADLEGRFIRPGLWYSAYFGGGAIISFQGRIHIIPDAAARDFFNGLKTRGAAAIFEYTSFPDPTAPSGEQPITPVPEGDLLFQHLCPHCGQPLKIRRKYAGQSGSCKKCGGQFIAPSLPY